MMDDSLVGVGLYTVPEAAALLHLRPERVRRWAYGYRCGPPGGRQPSPPIITAELGWVAGVQTLSFLDLIELHFIDAFHQTGVSLYVIRAAAKEARKRFGHDHPFAVERFSTDGKGIFAELKIKPEEGQTEGDLTEQLEKSQLVFGPMVQGFFVAHIDIEEVEAGRYWPFGRDEPVVLDRRRRFGKPIDPGSGIATFTLHQASLSGEPLDAIADWYGVTTEALEAAIRFEESLMAA